MGLINQSLQELEWPALLGHFSALCRSAPGKDQGLNWAPAETKEEAILLLNATDEAIGLEEFSPATELDSLTDLSSLIERVRLESVLSAKEILEILHLLSTSRANKTRINDYFAQITKGPYLTKTETQLLANTNLEKAIQHVIDEDSNVRDSASQELRALRARERKLHSEAKEKLDAIVQSAFREGVIQDRFSDFRDGRYLIPVKREFRTSIEGTIADSSSSKATVFIEPAALRHINDQIRQAQVEIEEEIYRLLRELSLKISPEAKPLEMAYTALIDLDLSLARARLATHFLHFRGAKKPEFSDDLELEGLYHPLLSFVIAKDKLVRNTITLDRGSRVLLISGPNTGGKTVILKATGLTSIMARAGFFIPCSGSARIPFFTKVLAHIGDSQNIELSLSSFSGSVAHLKQILETADSNTLILIDEILHETDPDEAAALAKSILLELREKNAFVVVTTHLNGLKMAEGDIFQNASMEFDQQSLSPTYRLRFGVPGSSHALDISTRLGLSKTIVDRARGFLKKDHHQYEELVNSLAEKERLLSEAKEKISDEQDTVAALKNSLEQQLHLLTEERKKWRKDAEERLSERIHEVSSSVKKTLDEFKGRIKDIGEKHRFIESAKQVAKQTTAAFEPLREEFQLQSPKEQASENTDAALWKVGAQVWVRSLKTEATLQSEPTDKNKPAEVLIGKMKMRVPWHELKMLSKEIQEKPKKAALVSLEGRTSIAPELRLIGKTVEDAEAELSLYLDQASRSDRKIVRIVHGHGTGALKRAVREFLQRGGYNLKYRPGEASEGGDGCTVVEFE